MSPAQKVLAAIDACDGESDVTVAVAALRAAADEVVPEEPSPVSLMGPVYVAEAKQRRKVRAAFYAIAAELEAQP
jgi:hypothetical protein